jgi:hypothetical protein
LEVHNMLISWVLAVTHEIHPCAIQMRLWTWSYWVGARMSQNFKAIGMKWMHFTCEKECEFGRPEGECNDLNVPPEVPVLEP